MNVGTAMERPAVAVGDGGGRRGGRRWRAVLVVIVVVAAAAAAFAVAGVWKRTAAPQAGGTGAFKTSTAIVTRRTLVSHTQVSATLQDAGSYSVVNQASGTLTRLPAVGRVVRQGQALYQVNGLPVVLLYGNVPAWRTLSAGMTGRDVRELNAGLVRLGYATAAALGPRAGWDYFSSETAYALEQFQEHLGITSPTGKLTLGQAVFLPSAVKITAWGTSVAPGTAAAPGTALMTATSDSPVVSIALDSADEPEVKAGDTVAVTLPTGSTAAGVVTSVGTVATTNASTGATTVTVLVALKHPAVARRLSSAPVTVSITTGRVRNALVVPVTALLAQPGGGYAVEVTGPGGHHLVAVSIGMIDNATGLVQITSTRLTVGQRVVVPAL
ncbi:MAG TPA: peptidoglycan-binding protein [Streptosporangiaceae bacterium]|nr:peptidoglycan-binding protein [Streptosporangiaceae bacterium]